MMSSRKFASSKNQKQENQVENFLPNQKNECFEFLEFVGSELEKQKREFT